VKKPLQAILDTFPDLNDKQLEAIRTTDGPLQIIAGPGTGKTLVLILRTLYLIMSEKASPSEIVLTTFTEKATFELRDRINQIARKMGVVVQLHELRIGTIHSICADFINKYIHITPLKKNYVVLDELTQHLFLYENFDRVVTNKINDRFLGRWNYKWTTIKELLPYVNKLTEELVDLKKLSRASDEFLEELAGVYRRYQDVMYKNNRVDFAHLQKIFFDLLQHRELYPRIKGNIRYIMVDEYQDTNYIQEQIFLSLSKPDHNICVVGDEDQALYRFRGATVRNILEFQNNFQNCKQITLSINYRSHRNIIASYNKFINSIDWEGSDGKIFRFPKAIQPNPKGNFPEYPSVFCIWGKDEKYEAERLVHMVRFFKENKIIQDYSQIALLLRSVRLENSQHYVEALKKYGIPYFNPRARTYFENDEVKLLIACYAIIFGMHGEALQQPELKRYVEDAIKILYTNLNHDLQGYLRGKVKQISNLKEGESLDLTIVDYFYQLLAYEPLSLFLQDENKARNLSIFSHLFDTFQIYYNISLVTFKNRNFIGHYLFNSFFNFLIQGGIDEYEDPDNPIPKGYVQIMTIHQSKGLEFPVIVAGSLDKNFSVGKQVDRDLEPFYPRGSFEPENRVTEFDRMRHFYVAFSRAQKILVLTTANKPKEWFSPIWDSLDQWPYVEQKTLKSLRFDSKPQFVPKKSYGLSSHINIYETCPKQYLFYKEYDFSPSRYGGVLFGTIVHQTIEDIHRFVLDGRLARINPGQIKKWFEQNYSSLIACGFRPIGKTQKENALKQATDYFRENHEDLKRILEAEVDVSVEKEDYIIGGKIDLLLGKDGKLELLDFKTQPKPNMTDNMMNRYFKQLCLYAHILTEKHRRKPERLLIYWTAKPKKKDALTEFEYCEKDIEQAGRHFDEVVKRIKAREFEVHSPPDHKICKDCDFRFYCSQNGVIEFKERSF
jgi:DNA helicase-2/ATP-dependent DNA helicase PcrA